MICPEMLRKIDAKVSDLEYLNAELQKENQKMKRVIAAVIEEWENVGVVDVDVLKKII